MISVLRDELLSGLRSAGLTFDLLRLRLLATDPGLVRLRLALRVTLTGLLILGALTLVHVAVMRLAPAAFSAGLLFAIQGVVAIRDPSPAERLRTRIVSGSAGFAVLAVFSLLAPTPRVVDALFLLVAFVAVYIRRWGQRWTAVGMFAFMASFSGTYFRPSPLDLTGIAVAMLLTGMAAHLVREVLVADRPLADLRRALASVDHRVGRVAAAIGEGERKGWTQARRRRVRAAHQRVRDALGIVETMLPDEPRRGEAADDAAPLAIELFDLNLALESALGHALSPVDGGDDGRRQLADGLRRLAHVRRRLRRTAAGLGDSDLAPAPQASVTPKVQSWSSLWNDEAARLAVQVTLACALAMAGGMWLSTDRWFWAVLTAFLVFTNVQSRGDTALRGMGRAGGTAVGIIAGMGLAIWLQGAVGPSLALCVVFTFLAFFFLQASYGTMTFFVTVTLSLVYGLLGNFTPELLVLRLEETVIGTASGILVSFLVFPQRTSAATGKAIAAFLKDLDRLIEAVEDRLDGTASDWRIYAISRALDRRHAAILTASRPLGRSWASGGRRRSARIGRLRFAVLSHWAHRLAAASVKPLSDTKGLRDELRRCRSAIGAMSEADFFQRMATLPARADIAGQRDTASGDDLDPVLAARAITHTLTQLLPEAGTRNAEAIESPSQTGR